MSTNRLELALKLLKPSDWERFERLASVFLAVDFDDLRTMATPSGDGGRDSEIYSPKNDPSVVIQYSVSVDWAAKVTRTIARLVELKSQASVLVYASNQKIGPSADNLKRTLREKHGVSLDIRDQSYFLERAFGSHASEKAAEELAEVIVDPYLHKSGVGSYVASELSPSESTAALTFLGLQWVDDSRGKGLTRLAFEALVRAVLVETSSEQRMGRLEVHRRISELLPGHDEHTVAKYVDKALRRLTKVSIRHWTKQDEFCITFEEQERLSEYKTNLALSEAGLRESILDIGRSILIDRNIDYEDFLKLSIHIRAAAESILQSHSQLFAKSVQSGDMEIFSDFDMRDEILNEISAASFPKIVGADWIDILSVGVHELMSSDDPSIQKHLRSLADSYTLLSFLRETPDVQAAIDKMFSFGKIWLDTNIVLPLLAETVLEESNGPFTRMLNASLEAGMELFVTEGVVKETERHMNKALTCAKMIGGSWKGATPYLLAQFMASGRGLLEFEPWLENFRGKARPEEDISDFLQDEFDIFTKSLISESDNASDDLRNALQVHWEEVHHTRRSSSDGQIDSLGLSSLIANDIECFCGVVMARAQEKSSSFGYTAWWLTMDSKAFHMKSKLRELMAGEPPDSPVLSIDFLVNYLAFGPARNRLSKNTESLLPPIIGAGGAGYLTPEIIAEAEVIRNDLEGLPRRLVNRRIRDELDRARHRIGPLAKSGLDDF